MTINKGLDLLLELKGELTKLRKNTSDISSISNELLIIKMEFGGRMKLDDSTVEKIEKINHRFFVRVWSAPLPEGCALQLGAQVNVRVQLSVSAHSVPAASVFYLHGQASIFVRHDDTLKAVPITLIGNTDNDSAVFTAPDLTNNDEVLTSSISAVQGILLGLGGIE